MLISSLGNLTLAFGALLIASVLISQISHTLENVYDDPHCDS
jgi:hypothetical protein